MKGKGPVDFLLGIFLEFGAAFCLLFFLPEIPWHLWQPPAELNGRQVDFRPVEVRGASHPPASFSRRPPAPPLLEQSEEAVFASAPVPTGNYETQARSYYAQPSLRRDFPRDYRY